MKKRFWGSKRLAGAALAALMLLSAFVMTAVALGSGTAGAIPVGDEGLVIYSDYQEELGLGTATPSTVWTDGNGGTLEWDAEQFTVTMTNFCLVGNRAEEPALNLPFREKQGVRLILHGENSITNTKVAEAALYSYIYVSATVEGDGSLTVNGSRTTAEQPAEREFYSFAAVRANFTLNSGTLIVNGGDLYFSEPYTAVQSAGYSGNLTVNGGTLIAKSGITPGGSAVTAGIVSCLYGDAVTINGGEVYADGADYGLYAKDFRLPLYSTGRVYATGSLGGFGGFDRPDDPGILLFGSRERGADEADVTGEVTVEARQGTTGSVHYDYKTGIYPAKTIAARRDNTQFIRLKTTGAELASGSAVYAFATGNIRPESVLSVVWSDGAPAGVTAQCDVEAGELTLTSDGTAEPGVYRFRLTLGDVSSNETALAIGDYPAKLVTAGQADVYFASFDDAHEAAKQTAGATVRLLAGLALSGDLTLDGDYTLDLGGWNITGGGLLIRNGANLAGSGSVSETVLGAGGLVSGGSHGVLRSNDGKTIGEHMTGLYYVTRKNDHSDSIWNALSKDFAAVVRIDNAVVHHIPFLFAQPEDVVSVVGKGDIRVFIWGDPDFGYARPGGSFTLYDEDGNTLGAGGFNLVETDGTFHTAANPQLLNFPIKITNLSAGTYRIRIRLSYAAAACTDKRYPDEPWNNEPCGISTEWYQIQSELFTLTLTEAEPEYASPGDYALNWNRHTGLLYTGAAQRLIPQGTPLPQAQNGTLQYRLSEDAEWSDEVPTATEPGYYTIYCRVKGNEGYLDYESEQLNGYAVINAATLEKDGEISYYPTVEEALAEAKKERNRGCLLHSYAPAKALVIDSGSFSLAGEAVGSVTVAGSADITLTAGAFGTVTVRSGGRLTVQSGVTAKAICVEQDGTLTGLDRAAYPVVVTKPTEPDDTLYCADLGTALNAVEAGGCIRLTDNVTFDADGYRNAAGGNAITGSFVLDLGGYTLSGSSKEAVLLFGAGSFTVWNGGVENLFRGADLGTGIRMLDDTGCELTLAAVQVSGGTAGATGSVQLNSVFVGSGNRLTVESGRFIGALYIEYGGEPDVTLKGSSFEDGIVMNWVGSHPGLFRRLLGAGMAFYDAAGAVVDASLDYAARHTQQLPGPVTVAVHSHSYTDGSCACGEVCLHPQGHDSAGKCPVCAVQLKVARVGDRYFDSYELAAAYVNWQGSGTLTLLADITAKTSSDTLVPLLCSVTLELNGFSINWVYVGWYWTDEEGYTITSHTPGHLTLTGSGKVTYLVVMDGSVTMAGGSVEQLGLHGVDGIALTVTGGEIDWLSVFSDRSTVRIAGGTVHALDVDSEGGSVRFEGGTGHGGKDDYRSWLLQSGTVTVTGGSFGKLRLTVYDGCELRLMGGSFAALSTEHPVSSELPQPPLAELVGEGFVFLDAAGSPVNAGSLLTLENVTVAGGHLHELTGDTCTVCGKSFEAVLIDADGNETYVRRLTDAHFAGCTVVLLRDLNDTGRNRYTVGSAACIIDLNGHTLGALLIEGTGTVTLTGRGTVEELRIGEALGGTLVIDGSGVTVTELILSVNRGTRLTNGSFGSVNLASGPSGLLPIPADFLADGYAFANADGGWENGYLGALGGVRVTKHSHAFSPTSEGTAACPCGFVCRHDGATEVRGAQAATCTEPGYTGDTYCLGCNTKIASGATIDAPGHKGGKANCHAKAVCEVCHAEYGELYADHHDGATEVRGAQAATCTEPGYTGDTYCLGCNTKIADGSTIAAPGHKGGEANCHAKAVCEVCHAEYGELDATNHDGATEVRNAQAATCTEPGYTGDTYCLGCNTKIEDGTSIAALGHKGGKANCHAKAVCEVCHAEYGEINPHHHAELTRVEATPATASAEGNMAYYLCAGCSGIFRDADASERMDVSDTVIEKRKPEIIEGAGGSWQKGTDGELRFRSDAAFGDFLEVLVDGVPLDPAHYDLRAGSILVEPKRAYLETLAEGNHTLTIRSVSGDATAEFTVDAAASSGSRAGRIWLTVAASVLIAGAGLTAVFFLLRKKRML